MEILHPFKLGLDIDKFMEMGGKERLWPCMGSPVQEFKDRLRYGKPVNGARPPANLIKNDNALYLSDYVRIARTPSSPYQRVVHPFNRAVHDAGCDNIAQP